MVAAFDVTAADRSELTDLLRALTDRVRFLTTGGSPAPLGITAPPADSGVLGPTVPGDGLTVTVGVGASLFDQRYGLAAVKPAKLKTMHMFPNDDLIPDSATETCACSWPPRNTDTVLHALRDIARQPGAGCRCAGDQRVHLTGRGRRVPHEI